METKFGARNTNPVMHRERMLLQICSQQEEVRQETIKTSSFAVLNQEDQPTNKNQDDQQTNKHIPKFFY